MIRFWFGWNYSIQSQLIIFEKPFMKQLSFAIVGGGPAGFYTAKLLSKLPFAPQIHIYEKQLCPFGLIRYGVAPDHVSIKKSELVLSEIQKYPNFNYIGNYNVTPQKLKQLQEKYSGVVFSFGANGDSLPLGLHEQNHHVNLPSVKLARQIVYWYNNHPDYEQYQLDLTKVKNVTIIGNGNVAIDIARVFLRKPQEMALTQISPNALQALAKSSVQNVTIVGRRGVVQSAFALKQVRELTKFNIKLYAIQQELQSSLNDASHFQCTALGDHFSNLIRLNKRKIDFVKEKVEIIPESQLPTVMQNGEKKVIFRFLLNPHSVKENHKLQFSKTYLSGEPFKQKSIDTDETVQISHDMLVFSTGFEVRNIDGSKTEQNRLPNSHGCVIKEGEKLQIGKYASGWCKTGPQGVIDQTLLGCEETFNNIRIHCQKEVIKEKEPLRFQEIFNPSANVSWEQYKKVRQMELNRGNEQKFIKKKLSRQEIMQVYGLRE